MGFDIYIRYMYYLYLYLGKFVALSVCLIAIEIYTEAFETSTISHLMYFVTMGAITYITGTSSPQKKKTP